MSHCLKLVQKICVPLYTAVSAGSCSRLLPKKSVLFYFLSSIYIGHLFPFPYFPPRPLSLIGRSDVMTIHWLFTVTSSNWQAVFMQRTDTSERIFMNFGPIKFQVLAFSTEWFRFHFFCCLYTVSGLKRCNNLGLSLHFKPNLHSEVWIL